MKKSQKKSELEKGYNICLCLDALGESFLNTKFADKTDIFTWWVAEL